MENNANKMQTLQKKSREVLLRLLNNIGVVGAILAAIADIIFVIIMVVGVKVKASLSAIIIFAVINALIGILINILLRYQGQKYAELENVELCEQFYTKRIREKKYMSMGAWMILKCIQDFVIKGGTTAFSIFGIIYISITGSKNPIQILITLASLVLFACFGLIGMNSAYTRFYNVQVPYMEVKVMEGDGAGDSNNSNSPSSNVCNNVNASEVGTVEKELTEEEEDFLQKIHEEVVEEFYKNNKERT